MSRLCGGEVMAVLAKPSANGAHGWRAAAVPAALLGAILIIGCGGSSSGGAAATALGTIAQVPGQSASPTACAPWAGLNDLSNVTTWLRQMIGDEVIFGTGTAQAKRDGVAVVVYAKSLGGLEEKLPARYARDLRSSVLPVAASPYKRTPEQLNAAANQAQTLAQQISQLCF
jgi:hypothetical protein